MTLKVLSLAPVSPLNFRLLHPASACMSNRPLQFNTSRSGVLIPPLSVRFSKSPVLMFPHLSTLTAPPLGVLFAWFLSFCLSPGSTHRIRVHIHPHCKPVASHLGYGTSLTAGLHVSLHYRIFSRQQQMFLLKPKSYREAPLLRILQGLPKPQSPSLDWKPHLICSAGASVVVRQAQSLLQLFWSCTPLCQNCCAWSILGLECLSLRNWLACLGWIVPCLRGPTWPPLTIPCPLHIHRFAHFLLLLDILCVCLSLVWDVGMRVAPLCIACLCPQHQHLAGSRCSLNVKWTNGMWQLNNVP